MYVDKKSHHIIFYTIETKSDGERVIKVRKCIHSTELKKELKNNLSISNLEMNNKLLEISSLISQEKERENKKGYSYI